MAENKKGVEQCWRIIYNPQYKFHDQYGLCFLEIGSYNLIMEALSELRRSKEINGHTYHIASSLFRHHYKNSIKIKDLDASQPRLIAQKFIGKKNIRTFIFKRDNHSCLRCGSQDKLQVDHIFPISKGGVNKISNLQTLCNTCNAKKRDTFKDYRNGAR